MTSMQQPALAAFAAARNLYIEHRFVEARQRMREYQRVIDYRRFPVTEQRGVAYPVCSVILVIHSAGVDTLTSIDRLLAQSASRAEVIVVDNGDSEALYDALASCPLLHVRCPYNLLPAEGRNIGAFFARSPLLVFMDDDGLPADDYIEQAIAALAPPEVIGVRGRIRPRQPNGPVGPHYDLGDRPTDDASFNLEGNMAIRRGIFRAVGGFDPLMFGHEGHELADRCRRAKPEELIRYWPGLMLQHDFADGDRLTAKRERQRLGEAYRAFLKPIFGGLTPRHPREEPADHGISIIVHDGDIEALASCLDVVNGIAWQCPVELLLLVDVHDADQLAHAKSQMAQWGGRSKCLLLPARHWNQPSLAARARHETLLLVEGTPCLDPVLLGEAASMLAAASGEWLDLSAQVQAPTLMVRRESYLARWVAEAESSRENA